MYFYNKAIVYADYTFPENDQQRQQMDTLLAQVNVNMGICHCKRAEWNKALIFFQEAIKVCDYEHNHALVGSKKKALYWLVKCKIKDGKFDQAEKPINDL